MAYLLDVNILIARSDRSHANHKLVTDWFLRNFEALKMTCPIVENGFVRIFGNPNYPNGPGTIEKATRFPKAIHQQPTHRFVADDISLATAKVFESFENVGSKHLTDVYLLGLAAKQGLTFVRLDSKIRDGAVKNGTDSLEVIEIPTK
ncbi:MAG: TA system VapC family ribonuclease toxin [Verrucomicrobiales bacterium]